MAGIGLVLGAGGPIGWAYHLGVIEAVRDVLGLGPDQLDRIVGTSAGGAIAASAMAGADTGEILASVSRPMAPEDQARMREARRRIFRRSPRSLLPQAPRLLTKGGAVGLLPPGVFPTFPLRRFPTDGLRHWPSSLWLPSVRLDDGRLVVFGRDTTDVSIADAVEATSAVPAMFRPKEIDGRRHVDGAVASATNAGLLADEGLDLVVISSPMTRPGNGPVKRRARRQLADERAELHRNGSRTVAVAPTSEIMALADGFPRNNVEAGPSIVAAARRQATDALLDSTRRPRQVR